MHPMQPSQGATAPTAIQMGNAPLQPIIAPPAVSAPNASMMQQQPPMMPHSQPQQQQQQQQQQTLISKQNKVTPIAKPAGLDPVVVLQASFHTTNVLDVTNSSSCNRRGKTGWQRASLTASKNSAICPPRWAKICE